MKSFNTLDEVKSDKNLQSMGRYDWEKILLNGKEVFACTTVQQYEDIVWGGVYGIFYNLFNHFQIADDVPEDLVLEIRDNILKELKSYGIEFVDICDEY